MLALPFVFALPANADRIAAHSRSMYALPPAWFLGSRTPALRRRGRVHVPARAHRRGRLAAAAGDRRRQLRRALPALRSRHAAIAPRRPPAAAPAPLTSDNRWRAATADFTHATLRRSALHQGVLLGIERVRRRARAESPGRPAGDRLAPAAGRSPLRRRHRRDGRAVAAHVRHGLADANRDRAADRAARELDFPDDRERRHARRAASSGRASDAAGHGRRAAAADGAARVGAVRSARDLRARRQRRVRAVVGRSAASAAGARIPFTCSYMPGKQTVAQTTVVGIGLLVLGVTLVRRHRRRQRTRAALRRRRHRAARHRRIRVRPRPRRALEPTHRWNSTTSCRRLSKR